ncbi:MAG: hypothetical protein WBE01_02420, partial [Methyloceanibacter sp.]
LSIAIFTSFELTASTAMLSVLSHSNIGDSGKVSAILTKLIAMAIVALAQNDAEMEDDRA